MRRSNVLVGVDVGGKGSLHGEELYSPASPFALLFCVITLALLRFMPGMKGMATTRGKQDAVTSNDTIANQSVVLHTTRPSNARMCIAVRRRQSLSHLRSPEHGRKSKSVSNAYSHVPLIPHIFEKVLMAIDILESSCSTALCHVTNVRRTRERYDFIDYRNSDHVPV